MSTATNTRYDKNARIGQWLQMLESPTLAVPVDLVTGFAPVAPVDLTARVRAFQAANGLVADGIFGRKTYGAMYALLRQKSIAALPLELQPKSGKKLVILNGDPYKDDNMNFPMRADVAFFLHQAMQEVRAAGGIIPSAGSLRALNAPLTAGRVARSWHYFAGAFDLHTYAGFQDPTKDPLVIVVDGDFHRVYVRCTQSRPDVVLPPEIELKNPCSQRDRTGAKAKPVRGHFLDLTAVFAKYGFARIPPHSGFRTNPRTNYMTAEWWHFQLEVWMMPEFSTFIEQLLLLYTEAQLRNTPPMRAGDAVFGVDFR